MNTISRNIADHKDIGLNADYCISAYQMNPDHIIFDNEDDTFSLCHIDHNARSTEEEFTALHTGTFAECVTAFEAIQHKAEPAMTTAIKSLIVKRKSLVNQLDELNVLFGQCGENTGARKHLKRRILETRGAIEGISLALNYVRKA